MGIKSPNDGRANVLVGVRELEHGRARFRAIVGTVYTAYDRACALSRTGCTRLRRDRGLKGSGPVGLVPLGLKRKGRKPLQLDQVLL
jgi:hypothetical protein